MCKYNDEIRNNYNTKIEKLKLEKTSEENKRSDINRACQEIRQMLNNTQCVINNISECSFGGYKILSSIKLSDQGYNERNDFYSEYYIKCQNAIEQINKEINETTLLRDTLPKNCGKCSQCCQVADNNSGKEE